MQEIEKNVLSLYIQDQSEKLHVFDDLQKRIATLMDLINSKFQAQGKYLVIDRERGFLFKTDIGGGRIFRPAELSSGEQQQLVLFYELIFKTSKKSLVLIDEPEISLDVGWQRRFLDDLAKVISLDRISILMATHSPQIIHNRRDLAVPLSGGVEE
jgi:ABC-type glutathione transport system ATPase component